MTVLCLPVVAVFLCLVLCRNCHGQDDQSGSGSGSETTAIECEEPLYAFRENSSVVVCGYTSGELSLPEKIIATVLGEDGTDLAGEMYELQMVPPQRYCTELSIEDDLIPEPPTFYTIRLEWGGPTPNIVPQPGSCDLVVVDDDDFYSICYPNPSFPLELFLFLNYSIFPFCLATLDVEPVLSDECGQIERNCSIFSNTDLNRLPLDQQIMTVGESFGRDLEMVCVEEILSFVQDLYPVNISSPPEEACMADCALYTGGVDDCSERILVLHNVDGPSALDTESEFVLESCPTDLVFHFSCCQSEVPNSCYRENETSSGLTTLHPSVPTTTFPATPQPSVPTSSQPSVPISSQPSVPTTTFPATPQPSVPTSSQPSVPTSTQPSVPISSQPSVPTTTFPATPQPSVPTSSQPSVPTSSQPSVPKSSQPSVPTSSQPSVPTSSQPSVPTSSLPSVPTSSQPSVPTSSQLSQGESGSRLYIGVAIGGGIVFVVVIISTIIIVAFICIWQRKKRRKQINEGQHKMMETRYINTNNLYRGSGNLTYTNENAIQDNTAVSSRNEPVYGNGNSSIYVNENTI